MIFLTAVNDRRHTRYVSETTDIGFGDLFNARRTTAAVRFFNVRFPLHTLFYGWAEVGRSSDLPVASIAGSPTLLRARPPHLAMRRGPSMKWRPLMRANTPVRPEQSQSQIHKIIREALRAAALAPTYQDALDLTGAALRAVADLSRAEVSHG